MSGLAITVIALFGVYFVSQYKFHRPQVGDVPSGTPAFEAGFRPLDLILKLNGNPVKSWEEFAYELARHPSAPAQVTVLRDGQERNFNFTTPPEGRVEGLTPFWEAAVIAVRTNSPMQFYGVRTGDEVLRVEGVQISSLQQLKDALATHSPDTPLNLDLKSADKNETYSVGVSPLNSSYGFGPLGVESAVTVIADVASGGPGSKLGLKPGDRLLLINGQGPQDGFRFDRFLRDLKAQKKIQISILREDKVQQLELKDPAWNDARATDLHALLKTRSLQRFERRRRRRGFLCALAENTVTMNDGGGPLCRHT
ncbi:MAG: PDZ domain-containing protein [Calothrix sp. SM1_5_4]|nr:PDZ domain-containing protein [Calothrix sp. SM1_5_4]